MGRTLILNDTAATKNKACFVSWHNFKKKMRMSRQALKSTTAQSRRGRKGLMRELGLSFQCKRKRKGVLTEASIGHSEFFSSLNSWSKLSACAQLEYEDGHTDLSPLQGYEDAL